MATTSSALAPFMTKFGATTPDSIAQLLTGFSMGGLFQEFAQVNITAAGSTQANAFQTVGQTIHVGTCAAGAGILLPPAVLGLEVLVIHHGANALQVYGNVAAASGIGDTIDDVATATGVQQMVNSLVIYTCTSGATASAAGKWYSEGLATGFGGSGLQTVSFIDGVSAAGANQAGATVLTQKMITNVSTVAAGTGVLLWPSIAGMVVAINNNQATNALLIYPNGTEKINALAASVGFSAAVNTITVLYCFTAGQWFTK